VKDKHQEEWKKKYSFLVAETLAKPLTDAKKTLS